ncbi:MAG: preprotein translocase subunit SecE [Acidobacteria bacterium]|nr:preprotein translocase subunit SecE [Acidobacteriota bacterium]
MAMNREQKRLLRRQGEIGEDGAPTSTRRQPPSSRPQEERTSPVQFAREVRSELRKVAWPTRSETIHYSIIVLVTIVVLTTFIAGLDWLFSKFVLDLFAI